VITALSAPAAHARARQAAADIEAAAATHPDISTVTVVNGNHQALPRIREEVAGLTAQGRPLMPVLWQPRPVEHGPGPSRLPVPAGRFGSPSVP
jgi:hypothetical protein